MKILSYKQIFTTSRIKKLSTTGLAIFVSLATMPVYALPTGANIVAGSINIDATTANQLHVLQSSNKGIINWQGFNIGAGELTEFHLPTSSAITLNRVVGGDLSSIMGTLKSNGQIFLVNPNGIVFGAGSIVDVGGLVATTSNITDDNFMAGNFIFDEAGKQNSQIINEGNITALEGGLIALVSPQVINNGILQARLGKISLASGNKYTIDLYGDELINLAVDDKISAILQNQITNSGNISADGGIVSLSVSQATNVLDSIINMDGVIQANSVATKNGKIILAGGAGITRVNGNISAQGETGGNINILGDTVIIRENANINASGINGGGKILIGGDYQGKGTTKTATNTGIAKGAIIKADAKQNGNGGKVIVWADDSTAFYGNISANGGENSGNGGFVEVSGKKVLAFNGDVTTKAPNGEVGTLLLDPTDINIIDGAGPGADDAQVSGDGVILGADGGAVTFTIAEQTLEGIAAGTNINIQATNDITIADLTDNVLNLATTGSVLFTADSDSSGAGTFSMNAGDSILTGGASLQLTGAALNLGTLDTTAGAGAILLTAGAGGMVLNGDITTNGADISLTGNATLPANRILTTGAGSGSITINNNIDGGFDLTLNAGSGLVTSNGALGGTTTLNSFIPTGFIVTVNDVTTILSQTYNGLTALSGTLTTANNDVSFGSVISLTGTAGVNTGAGAGNVTFANTVNGGQDFTANAGTGNVSYGAAVGGGTALTSITTTAANISMAAAVTTTGDQTYNGATAITQDMTSGGSITFTGTASLGGANRTIYSGGGAAGVGDDINFLATVSEDFDLTLDAGDSVFGGNLSVGTLDVNKVTLKGQQATLNGDITVDTAFKTSLINRIVLASDVVITANDGGSTPRNITSPTGGITGGYNLTFNGKYISLYPITGVNNLLVNASTFLETDTTSTIGTQTYNGPSSIDVYGNLTSTNDNILFNNNVTLYTNVVMDTGAGVGNITFAGTVNPNGIISLTTTAGTGNVVFGGSVGNTVRLTSLTASGTNITGTSVLTTSDQTFTGISNFTGNLLSTAGSLTSTGNLTVGGTTTFDFTGENILVTGDFDAGGIVDIRDGSLTVTGLTTLNADITTDAGNVDLQSGVILNATPITITTGGTGGNISLAGAVDGATDLTLTAGTGSITSTGAIGGVTALNSLVASGTGGISVKDVTTTGAQTYTGNTTLNGDLATTNSNVGITGTTTLAGATTINTGAGAGNVTASSTIDGITSLAITAGTGDVTVSGAIGGSSALGTISISANNIILPAVTTFSNQTYTGTTDIKLNGDLASTTTGSIALTGDVTLPANRSISTSGLTGADIIFTNSTINDDFDLTLNAGLLGNITTPILDINNLILTNASQLTTSGDITTDSALSFTNVGNIVLGANTVLTANNGGASPQNVNFDALNVITGAYDLTVDGAAVTMYGINGINNLALTGSSFNILWGSVSTNGTQTYTGDTLVSGDVTSSNDNILFNNNASVLGTRTITTGAGAGNITFTGTVNSGTLTANAGTGNVTFASAVGDSTKLSTLTVTGANIDTNTVSTNGNQTYTGTTTIDGDLNILSGDVTINGNALLASNSILTAGANNDIAITGTTTGDYTLSLVAGTGDIALGGLDIDTWNLTSGDQLSLGGTFITDTAQSFTNMNNILLTADTTLRAYDGTTYQNITFDALNTVTGAYDFTVEGATLELYKIGDGTTNPVDLTLTATNQINMNDLIRTAGNQTYNAPTLDLITDFTTPGGDITFNTQATMLGNINISTGAGGGDILFTKKLDGTFDLNLTAGTGSVTAQDDFGTITPLNTFTVASASNISTKKVITIGAQSYGGPVSLGGDLTTTNSDIIFTGAVNLVADVSIDTGSGAGKVDFQDTLDGGYNLTLDTGTADIDFDKDVGATARLGDVTITNTNDFTMLGTTKVGSLTQILGSGTTSYGYAQGIDSDGAISIDTTPIIDGRIIRAGDTILRATETVTGEVHVRSLILAAESADLTGTINGKTDRDAARLVDLETYIPGPYFFNGYSLPVVGDVLSADTIFSDDNFSVDPNVSVPTLNLSSDTGNTFNPYSNDQILIAPDEDYSKLYEDIDYFNLPLWKYIELDILSQK